MSFRTMLACLAVLSVSCAFGAEGRKLALLISVRETREPRLHRLWFCDDDISGFATALPSIGFSAENITILQQRSVLDNISSTVQPTRANIRAGIKRLCKDALPNDTVLIAFSGHGVQLRRDGRIYLCPPEALLADPNSLLPLDDIVHELGAQCKAKLKLLLVDACRNDPTDPRPDNLPHPPETDPPPGVALFLGCSKGQQSLETGKVLHGLFFYHLIQGIQGAARDIMGDLTLHSLEDYLAREVSASRQLYGRGSHSIQTPEFRNAFRDPIVFNHAEGSKPSLLVIRGPATSDAAPLYTQWAAAYNATNPGATVDFRSGGFAGIKALKALTTMAVATDAAVPSSELTWSQTVLQIPSASTAVVPIVNLPGVQNLTLDGKLLADIFMGTVQNWNDPKIAALNPGIAFPDRHIVVVHPAEDTYAARAFVDFLSAANPAWNARPGSVQRIKWPVGAIGRGSDDIARIVANIEGTLGFVELSFLEKEKSLPPPQNGKTLNATFVQVLPLYGGEVANDPYPIRAKTYLLFFQDLSYLKDRKVAEELVKYLRWCVSQGMGMAGPAYGTLNAAQRAEVEGALRSIVFDGKPIVDEARQK